MEQSAIIGFATSIITEVFMLVPALRKNSLTAAITAIVVILVISFFSAGGITLEKFATSLVFALTSYKAIVQPVTKTIDSPTQS